MLEKRVSFAFRLTSLMTDLVDELEKIKDVKNLENVIIILDEAILNNKNKKYFSIKKAAKILQDNYFAELYHQCELISSLNEEINEYFKEMFKRYFDDNNNYCEKYDFHDYYYKNLVVCPEIHEEFMNVIINKKLGKDGFDNIDFFEICNKHIRTELISNHHLLTGYLRMIELYKKNIDFVDLDEI